MDGQIIAVQEGNLINGSNRFRKIDVLQGAASRKSRTNGFYALLHIDKGQTGAVRKGIVANLLDRARNF